MVFSWQVVGIELVRAIFYMLLSLVSGALVFRKYIAPDLVAALEEATGVASKLAALGGIKKADMDTSRNIEKAVAEDFIKNKIPELELVKTFVSPSTWEDIEQSIEDNPAAIIQLWEKYGHFFTDKQGQGQATQYDFE